MKTKEEISSKIARYKKAIDSPATSEKDRMDMQSRVEKLEQELAELEAKVDAIEETKPAEEEAPKGPSGKPKITAKNKDKAKSDCEEKLDEMKAIVLKYKQGKAVKQPGKKTERKKKKITTAIVDAAAAVFSRAIKSEFTEEKVVKIKVDQLIEAKNHFVKGLKAMRRAMGGISVENDQMIASFESQVDEWIAEVKEKQSKVTEQAA